MPLDQWSTIRDDLPPAPVGKDIFGNVWRCFTAFNNNNLDLHVITWKGVYHTLCNKETKLLSHVYYSMSIQHIYRLSIYDFTTLPWYESDAHSVGTIL